MGVVDAVVPVFAFMLMVVAAVVVVILRWGVKEFDVGRRRMTTTTAARKMTPPLLLLSEGNELAPNRILRCDFDIS